MMEMLIPNLWCDNLGCVEYSTCGWGRFYIHFVLVLNATGVMETTFKMKSWKVSKTDVEYKYEIDARIVSLSETDLSTLTTEIRMASFDELKAGKLQEEIASDGACDVAASNGGRERNARISLQL
jgi:hypothetical protein